ncbi:MAG: four helix bundle protein, partial [Limisphaerales bacterium]
FPPETRRPAANAGENSCQSEIQIEMRDYTKIEAWKLADDLTVLIYEITRSFPKEELYGLTSQLRRAVASVPANIAEGSARGTNKDYLHFLYIARASLTEAHYFVHLSKRLGYVGDEKHAELEALFRRTFACLLGLIAAVERESGKLGKAVAVITSAIVLGLARILPASLSP